MSVQVPLPPTFLTSSKFTDPTGKRGTFTKNTHRKQEFVRMSRSSTTAAPPIGSTSCSLGYRHSPVSARSSPLQQQTPQPQPHNEISDIGVLEDTERLDNRVLKEKSNLSKNASLAHRRKPSRATLRSSGVRFAEDTPQDQFWSESDANNNNNDEKLRIPHKQSVLVLPKVPVGGIKLNSVRDRIAKQDEKLTSKNVTAEPPKHHFFHNLDLKSAYSSGKTNAQQPSLQPSNEVKHDETTTTGTSSPKKLKPTKVSIANPRVTPQSDFLTSDDLVVALLNARNSKLSSTNLSSSIAASKDTNPASCANKMAATDGKWRSVTKLTKREENHVLLVEEQEEAEEEEEEVFFMSSSSARQPEVDELGQGQEPEAAGNVRVFHEQFMDDEEVEGDFGNGLMSLGVSKDYSSSLSSSQITVNGELCAQNSATADSTNLTSKLRSLLRDSGLDTTWEKNQTEFVDTVEMIDHEEQSTEALLSPKSDTTVIKDEQTSVKQLPEVTVNGDHRNDLWFAEDKLKTRSNIDWDKLEKLHCSDEIADVDWLQKVRLRNVLEDSSCENRISIPVSLSNPKQNGVHEDSKWMDPLLRLQQSGAVDWDSLDKKSLNTFGKVISNYSEEQTMTSASPSSHLKVNLKHVRQIEVRRSDNAAKTSEDIPAVRVHLRHVETPAVKTQQQQVVGSVQEKSMPESPDQVVLIKNTYNAQEWRQLEHEIENKRRPKVQTPSPDWVREAKEKRRSFHEWGSAFDSKQVRPCSDIADDGHKDSTQSTNQWMSIQQLRSKKQEQQEDWQETEVKNGHWQKDDGHSIRVHVPDVTSTDTVDREEHSAKFDVEGYVKGLVRMRKSVPSKCRPQSSPDFAAHIPTTPEWLPIAERKLRNSFDWDSLERKKKSKPDVSKMDFEDEEGASESDSSAFSWYGGHKATKALDGSNRHEDPEWVQVSSKKKNIDWEQLDADKPMTQSTEAVWVQGVNLKPARTTSAEVEDHDVAPFESVNLRHIDPPEEDSTRDFSSGVLWEERPTTPNVDRWQARYKEMFIDLSGESSPPEEDVNRRSVHQIELTDHGELRHGITWSRLLEDKVDMEEHVEGSKPKEPSFSEYRVTRHVGVRPESAEFRPNPAPSWTENLKKPSPPTTLNIKQEKTEEQSWLSQTRLRTVSSKTSLNDEDASPTTPDWMSKVEKRRSTTIDWDTINSGNKEPEANKDAQWLKELSLREMRRNPVPEKFIRDNNNKVSTEFKSLIKSPDVDAKKILEDLPKRRRGTVRPKEPEVLTGREALMADIKGGKAKLRTTSTTSLDNDVAPVPYKKEFSEVQTCPPAPLPPPPPVLLSTSRSSSLSQQPQSFANVLDQIKNSGRDGLLASLRRAKTETKSKMDDGEKVANVEQEQEQIAPEIVPKEPEENGSFQVTSDDGGNFSVVIDDKDDADFLTKKPDVSVYTKSLSEKYFRKELESPRKVPKDDLKTGSSSPPRVLSTLSKSQSLKSQQTSDNHSSKSRFSSDPGDRKLIWKVSGARKEDLGTGDNNLSAIQNRISSRHVTASLASTSVSKTLTSGSPKSTSVSPTSTSYFPTSISFSPESTSTPPKSTSVSPASTSSSLKSTLISPKSTSSSPTSSSNSPTSNLFQDLKKDSLASVKLLQEMRTHNTCNPDLVTSTNRSSTSSSFTSFRKEPLLGIRTIRETHSRNTSDPDLATGTDMNTAMSLTSLHLLRNISESPARLSVSDTDLVDSTGDVRRSSSRKVVTFDVEEPTATDDGCAMEDAEVAKITRRDVTDPKSWMSPTTSTSLKSRGVAASSSDAKPVSSRVSLSSKAIACKTTTTRGKSPTITKPRTERATSPKKETSRTSSSPSPTKFGSTTTPTGSGRGSAGRKARTERPSSPRKDSGRKKWEIPKPGSPVPVMCMAQETGSNSEASGSRRSSQFSQVIEEVAEGPMTKTETTEVTSLPEATRSITTHTTSGGRYVTAKGKDEKNGKDTLIGARGDSTKTISQLETIRGPDEAVVATREVHGTSGQTVSYKRLDSGA